MRPSATILSRRVRTLLASTLLAALPAAAGELRAAVRDGDSAPLADAIVVAIPEGATPLAEGPRPAQTVTIDQVNKEFVPYVMPLRVGTEVNFPNRDNIRHHVYSFSAAKRFELPLYIGDPATPVLFDQAGVVVLGCNIHDWMIAYLYVTPSPHFARTGADGAARLKDLPAGRYILRAWHPRMRAAESATERPLALHAEETVEVQWQLDLKPDFRIRRAPLPGAGGY